MIVKFLSSTASFEGVNYNTDKIETDRGELVVAKNFGALQGISSVGKQDYINYLKAYSAKSKRIKNPQLHVAISCKGREYSKEQLSDIAQQWLKLMGYGDNPYLLIFHKDTANNHIHLVSTRIGPDGKKVNDSFERLRAYQVMERILESPQAERTVKDIGDALSYSFSTAAQFMLLLEARGYTVQKEDKLFSVYKFGQKQGDIPVERVEGKISSYRRDKERTDRLKAFIHKYGKQHPGNLSTERELLPGGQQGKITGYSSALSRCLREKFGLQFIYHYSGEKPPYGYTVIDHKEKTVFKGGDIMPLLQLTALSPPKENSMTERTAEKVSLSGREDPEHENTRPPDNRQPGNGSAPKEYRTKTTAGQEEPVFIHSQSWGDHPANSERGESPSAEYSRTVSASEQNDNMMGQYPDLPVSYDHGIDISDDIDDEAILGRNRKRKRKARTNTR
ncbi:MAG: relaxase/mobilization nuclease domain-containing protein [Pseudosphingobacterium sp.]|nr:relaxase/mobilization nuclease domain-containing protein [Pseudosphingobacterium sp.]